MPNRSSAKRGEKDINETAFSIVQQATGQAPKQAPPKLPTKALPVTMAASVSTKAKKSGLTPAKRKAIAEKAARARWAKE